ncbi:hypothetical protein [Mycobacterium sp. NPDC050041]|uniref:hypothetical protein n=1 Tax=Mycobacterium sp. NPDC050041 TaxID=3364293 RepID=UPI003C2AACF0
MGTSALLAMGGLTVAFSTTSVAQPPGPVDSGSTTTTQASEEAPPEEAPAVTPSSAPPAVGKN